MFEGNYEISHQIKFFETAKRKLFLMTNKATFTTTIETVDFYHYLGSFFIEFVKLIIISSLDLYFRVVKF